MRGISRLVVALVIGAVMFCAADSTFGAPPDNIKLAPTKGGVAKVEGARTGGNFRMPQSDRSRKAEPEHENLKRFADGSKKFVGAAGALTLTVVWTVLKIVGVIFVVLVIFYFTRNRLQTRSSGANEDVVDSLAAAFDQAVLRVKTKRRELQSKVNVLAKRADAVQAKPKAKPRKRKAAPRARKTTAK